MINLTEKRYEGTPCVKCGGTVRFKSNGNCVACIKKNLKDTGASHKSKEKTKAETLAHYGGVCACCGESDPIFLNIDHIDQRGAAHRKVQPEAIGGARFYYFLKKNGYPKGYRVLCFNCNFATYHRGVCPHQSREASK